jgi:hypothetical protein
MLEKVDQIDFDELYELVLEAARSAFRQVQENHPDERFYTFALYYNFLGIISLACNSEEAHMQLRHVSDQERNIQSLKWFHKRWDFPQWRYCGWGYNYFTEASHWIICNLFQFLRPGTRRESAAWITVNHAIAMVCLKVLRTLDEEDLFGQGQQRENVVLNIVNSYGDQGDINYVYLLNSRSTYERWCFEQEMCQQALIVFPGPRFDPNPE